jgi:DNA polymerase-3 subunit delta'
LQFSSIIGQEHLKKHLIDSVKSEKVAHAQLFHGPEGNAKLALALAFATYLNCENQNGDSCGKCGSCLKMKKLIHPDLHFSFPVAPTVKFKKPEEVISQNFLSLFREALLKNPHLTLEEWLEAIGAENKQGNISKEESRQIIKKLSLKAFEGPYKIMIIWRPEYLHSTAANGLLKILEEPPEKTIFLLVSNDAEQLLPTILSRVQFRPVGAYTDKEINRHLSGMEVSQEQILTISRAAEGNLNLAMKMVGQVENESLKLFVEWMRLCYSHDWTGLVNWADNFQKLSKVTQRSLLQYGLHALRESLIMKTAGEALSRAVNEELQFIHRFSQNLSFTIIEHISMELDSAFYHLERNANPKIIALDTSIKIALNIK